MDGEALFLALAEERGFDRDGFRFRPVEGIPAARPSPGEVTIHYWHGAITVTPDEGESWVPLALKELDRGALGPAR